MNKTIEYYNHNAQEFYERTINADLSISYGAFLKQLPPQGRILDAGCGVGRDSKYFARNNYHVTAIDASQAMVDLASKETGLNVSLMRFQDMAWDQTFDGVWANASLLHIPYSETRDIYTKIHRALVPGGIFCGCYKYGSDYMPTPEREFWNMDENTILPYFQDLFEVIETRTEIDTRSRVTKSPSGKWFHFIARKI